MAKLKQAFQRKEKKYLLTEESYQLLRKKIHPKMLEDKYGLHTIASIYYDTDDFKLIRKSLEKPTYREKVRLRSYGVPKNGQKVFLEIKKKCQGIVYKRRLALPYEERANYLVQSDYPLETRVDRQIGREISWLIEQLDLKPKVLIAYDRRALYDPSDAEFRVTFDFNVRWRATDLDLLAGTEGSLVAPEIDVLMEVKALGAYPLWFSKLLAELEIYPGTFTKYGQTYQRYLFQEEDFKYVI